MVGSNPCLARILANFVKNFDRPVRGSTYELATLHAPTAGTWMVVWYNISPATDRLTRVRKTFGLNRIADPKERRAVAASIITALNAALARGYNFFTDGDELPTEDAPAAPVTLAEAFAKAHATRLIGVRRASELSFVSVARMFTEWAEQQGFAALPVSDFRMPQLQQYLEYRVAKGDSPRTVNNNVKYIVGVFNRMVKPLEILAANPLSGMHKLREEESERFVPFTADELATIAAHLKAWHPHFYTFTLFIYYGFMRPSHIRFLRRSQIDLEAGTIHIKGGETKGARTTTKQLMQPMVAALRTYGYADLPPDAYLLGKGFLPGGEFFANIKNDAGAKWRELVIGELGIDKKMYALKHTGGSLYVSENEAIDPAWLQSQMEHTSLAQTQDYIAKRKAKKIDDDGLKSALY
jgi:integrase